MTGTLTATMVAEHNRRAHAIDRWLSIQYPTVDYPALAKGTKTRRVVLDMCQDILRTTIDGALCGSFVSALLGGRLYDTFDAADHTNAEYVHLYVIFIRRIAPRIKCDRP